MTKSYIPLLLLLTSCIWGTSFVATEIVLREASVLTTLLLRLGLAALVLAAVLLRTRRGRAPLTLRSFFYLLALGLLSTSLYQLVQISANRLANASITALFASMHPLVLALFGRLFFKESLVWPKLTGIGLGLFGSLYIATGGAFRLDGHAQVVTALLLLLLNSVMWSAYSALSRKLQNEFSSFDLIAYTTVFGFVAFLPFAVPLARVWGVDVWREMVRLSPRAIGALAYLAFFCTILAYMLWIYCLRRIEMAKAGYYLYLEPVFAMAAAPFFVGNQVTPKVLLGALLICAGLLVFNLRASGAPTGERQIFPRSDGVDR